MDYLNAATDYLGGALGESGLKLLFTIWLKNLKASYNGEAVKSYESEREGLLAKLPKVRQLRETLSPQELEAVVSAERKVFDAIFTDSLPLRLRKDAVRPTGAFADDWVPPPPIERDATTRSIWRPTEAFRLGDSNYAGPNYAGGRYLNKGEKISKLDLAVLPANDLDLYSRDHDIRYQLIAGVKDKDLRQRLKDEANKIYHAQIFASETLPLEKGDLRKYQDKLIAALPYITSVIKIGSAYTQQRDAATEGVLRDIDRAIEPHVEVVYDFDEDEDGNLIPQVIGESLNLERQPNHLLRPLGDQYFYVPEPHYLQAHVDAELLPDLPATYRQTLRETLFNRVMESEGENLGVILRDPRVQRLLNLEDMFAQFRRIAAIRGGPEEHANRIAHRVANIRADLQNQFARHQIFDSENWDALPSPADIARWRATLDTLGSGRLAGIVAWQIATSVLHAYTLQRSLDGTLPGSLEQDPEFVKLVEAVLPDYKRGNELNKSLAEIIFRQGFAGDIDYQELTPEEVELYISALEIEIPDDRVVQTLRRLLPVVKKDVAELPLVIQEDGEKKVGLIEEMIKQVPIMIPEQITEEGREAMTEQEPKLEPARPAQTVGEFILEQIADMPDLERENLINSMRAFDREQIERFVELFGV